MQCNILMMILNTKKGYMQGTKFLSFVIYFVSAVKSY